MCKVPSPGKQTRVSCHLLIPATEWLGMAQQVWLEHVWGSGASCKSVLQQCTHVDSTAGSHVGIQLQKNNRVNAGQVALEGQALDALWVFDESQLLIQPHNIGLRKERYIGDVVADQPRYQALHQRSPKARSLPRRLHLHGQPHENFRKACRAHFHLSALPCTRACQAT